MTDSGALHRALIVDDDQIILLHAAQILDDAGFATSTALNAADALDQLETWEAPTGLLFTDAQMPGMDGFELARIVAARWPAIEIVVASGDLRPDKGDLPNNALFISKPFSAELVHELLRQRLPDHKQPAQLKS